MTELDAGAVKKRGPRGWSGINQLPGHASGVPNTALATGPDLFSYYLLSDQNFTVREACRPASTRVRDRMAERGIPGTVLLHLPHMPRRKHRRGDTPRETKGASDARWPVHAEPGCHEILRAQRRSESAVRGKGRFPGNPLRRRETQSGPWCCSPEPALFALTRLAWGPPPGSLDRLREA